METQTNKQALAEIETIRTTIEVSDIALTSLRKALKERPDDLLIKTFTQSHCNVREQAYLALFGRIDYSSLELRFDKIDRLWQTEYVEYAGGIEATDDEIEYFDHFLNLAEDEACKKFN